MVAKSKTLELMDQLAGPYKVSAQGARRLVGAGQYAVLLAAQHIVEVAISMAEERRQFRNYVTLVRPGPVPYVPRVKTAEASQTMHTKSRVSADKWLKRIEAGARIGSVSNE